MIDKWVVLTVVLASLRIGCCFPLRQTPYTYPHEASEWSTDGLGEWHGGGGGGAVYALPALALLITAVGLLLGCTWCYRHKDCKLFSASIGNLHDGSSRRSQPPDSGFSEAATAAPPAALENNNNGPISLREMQNIANNNALGYIATEDEEAAVTRNRESRIEFEPLPLPPAVAAADPLAPYSDWFDTSDENFSRNRLQYLHEISTEHYGRIVKGEMDRANGVEVVVVKILDVNDPSKKVQYLEEARVYRELKHENILQLLTYSLNEQPWLLIFEYCPMYLREFLLVNRHRSAMFNRRGVHLHLMHDVGAGLSYMHSHGFVYGDLSIDTILIREGSMRAVLGRYEEQPSREYDPPDVKHARTMSRDVWSLGQVLWEICSWEEVAQTGPPLPEPALPCLYRPQLYQIMQCCWNVNSEDRPTAEHIYLMLNHLYTNGLRIKPDFEDLVKLNEADEMNESNFQDDGYISSQFEERWQSLKPNTIPTLDEHRAIIHAPSSSRASHFTNSDQDFEDNAHGIQDSLSVDIETAVSRSSSIMSDRDPLSIHIKSESLTNLHGSLEDVRNIYLTHNENAVAEDHEQNPAVIGLQSYQDNSDSSDINKVDPWLKDIISDSQDDVSYYRDVSDVIKNLDNILNSEKTSSSESSHQASPSRDALTLDCKKDCPVQSSLVKSPGISNFQSILETTPERKVNEDIKVETSIEEDIERETIGALNHSFERYSESNSQHTDDTLSPDTPLDAKSQKDFEMESQVFVQDKLKSNMESIFLETNDVTHAKRNDNVVVIPNLRDLCIASVKTSLSNIKSERAKCQNEDCGVSCDKEEIIIPLDTSNTNFSLPKSVDYMPIEGQDIIVVSSTRVTNDAEESNTELNKANVICGNGEISSFDQHSVQNINDTLRSDFDRDITLSKHITSDDSTGYMDLTNETGRTILIRDTLVDNFKEVIRTCKGVTENDSDYLFALKNDSTIYLNLPELINVTNNLLDNERRYSTKFSVIQDSFHSKDQFSSSTPKSSEELKSITLNDTCETIETNKLEDVPESVPSNQLPGIVGAQLESKIVSENLSPFESPAKSHLTETYDENSSFALGPFEYSSLESFKGTKGHCVDFIEIPKEEQLAFSTHFAEIDLETPSPLRDINFLNEVPDIDLSEEVGCKNSIIICNEMAPEVEAEHNVESPQIIEMSMSQSLQIPATSEVDSTASTSSASVDVNPVVGSFQAEMIKFNLTTRLAMAENENNLNIEQSGPISIEEFLTNNPLIAMGTDEGVRNEPSFTEEHESESTHVVSASTDLESQVLCRSETDNSCIILNADNTTSSESPILLIAEASVLKELSESDNNVQAEGMSVSNPENLIYIVPESILAGNGDIENEVQSMPNAHSDCIVIRTSSDDPSALLFETNALPETVLAVGAPVYDGDSRLTLDDASVQALRNELELKLPIAQNACDQFDESDMWSGELPPPPELIVNYPGALSPIAEETRQQLNAYENQIQWETSENNRTDSSESYPEPCNDSTAEVTDMVTAVISGQPDDHTYTVHSDPTQPSQNNTYTVQKEATTSKELTMSADSLNVSGSKQTFDTNMQLNDDKTFSLYKDDDCEKLSQVSPFMLSPTTESSMPEPSDNGPGVSTMSKTAPSDTKSSKPSETQCLSKVTSIDSWCSNDTLFNVEDNFDDLAMDSDVGLEYEVEKEVDRSNSTGTLTDHDVDKETSHCSTYIVHDSKSDIGESFTPDSITANHTYTKPKKEEDKMSTLLTKSEVNDSSAKNTPTRDLAYGTLISGGNSNVASHSNCTTEIFSGKDDPWKVHPQVEMVRHTKDAEESVNITPPIITDLINEENIVDRPKVDSVPQIRKMDSVDISCLHDNINFERFAPDTFEAPTLDYHLVNMGNSVTSTPIYPEPQVDTENIQPVPMLLPKTAASSSFDNIMGLPNLQSFFYSAELRPQDIDSSIVNDTGDLLEPEKQLLSASNTSSKVQDTYSDFEFSATFKPQGGNSQETNAVHSQCESGGSISDEFHRFENSVRHRPQDLSVLVQVSPRSEIKEALNPNTEINEVVNAHVKLENVSHVNEVEESDYMHVRKDETNVHDLSSLQEINDLNSLDRNNMDSLPDKFDNNSHIVCEEISSSYSSLPPLHIVTADELINADESEHEQPHSIIITDNCHVNTCKDNSYDSPADTNLQFNEAINSRLGRVKVAPVLNGESHDGPTASEDMVQDANDDNVLVQQQIIKENGITSNEVGTCSWNEPREGSDSGINCRTNGENYATVSFLKEPFEELPTSINEIDSADKVSCDTEKTTLAASKSEELHMKNPPPKRLSFEDVTSLENVTLNLTEEVQTECENESNHILNSKHSPEMGALTEDFLEKEKNFCQFSTYLPLLGDIRFTGPGSDIMSTSFNQESPTDEQSVRTEQSKQPDATSDELKEWDSDTDDSQSTNSSSGEFIWKQRDGAGGERGDSDGGQRAPESESRGGGSGDSGSASGSGSGSGSEGDEVEFVPSSWDCRAAPAKSSLRSLEAQADNKKRVVFKRQKYHCVYEYPREASDSESGSAPALPSHRLLPDYSTYAEWAASGDESELGYGLYAPRPLRAVPAYGPDYDDDFFISSSARPFESLCLLSSSSQFFPGMRTAAHPLKVRDDELAPAPAAAVAAARTCLPSLDFTTPDSGVEDVTPGSLPPVDDDAAALSWPMPPVLANTSWKGTDSASSSESVSPSSPGGGGVEALGGLRHTRDRLKLDLPPSPLLPSPSPRHSRVFSFGVPDKPRRPATAPAELDDEYAPPPPTFSTFGKRAPADLPAPDTALILTDEGGDRHAPAPVTTATDSGDEDSGIESSAKAAPAPEPAPAPAAARPDRAPL